jgi:predicted alpha/beta superfamily hydrolase
MMQKRPFTAFFSLFLILPTFLSAQLTLRVVAIPANTPAGANIHAVGTFNNWAPGDPATIMKKETNGNYTLTVNPPVGQVKFKFTRGSWATVEGNANGQFLPDRVFDYTGQATTIDLTILSWEDLGGGSGGSTAAPNVSVLDNMFFMPQLNRSRKIWVYLPPDYQTTTKRYPVLYMHDAQNLFDVKTSFSGEWKVDESLNDLHSKGDYGCIVIGIDNGGGERLNEYSPWVNTQYGGGLGDEYIEFVANTLKPFVDGKYRTLPGRNTTGIMGSSMGGLISMFGFSERQDVFSRAGIFSPAFWFGGNNSVNHTASKTKKGDARVYFLAGGKEPASVTTNMDAVSNAMTTAGFLSAEKKRLTPADGEHSEWFWAREFPDAYKWLFGNLVLSGKEAEHTKTVVEIFPNPATQFIRLANLEAGQIYDYQIFNSTGALKDSATVVNGQTIWVQNLPKGVYFLKLRKQGKDGSWMNGRFIR